MPRIVDHEERRERLALAVLPAFLDRGYAALSMQSLADAAGITKSGAYHYFAGKAEWFGAACSAALREEASALRALAGAGTPLERLERLVADGGEIEASGRMRTLVLVEAVRGGAGPDIAPALARYVDDLAELLGVPHAAAQQLVIALAGYSLLREIDPACEVASLLATIVRAA